MKVQPVVRQETRKIAIGTVLLACLMLLIFLIAGRFTLSVLLGAALGVAFAVGNFFLMALSVQKSAERMSNAQVAPLPEDENAPPPPLSKEAQQAKKFMQASYLGRMLLLGGGLILAVTLPCFDAVAMALCLLFPRIVIFVNGILTKKEA